MKLKHTMSLEDEPMRKEYDIEKLNPRRNPYAKRLKSKVTINLSDMAIMYFKEQSGVTGIPYQTLIDLYLMDCAQNKRKLQLSWK